MTFRFPMLRARTCCGWLSRLFSSAGQRCQCAAASHWCGLPSWFRTVRENPYSWFPLWRGTPTAQWRYGNSPLTENPPRCRGSLPRIMSDNPPYCGVAHIPCLPTDCPHHCEDASTLPYPRPMPGHWNGHGQTATPVSEPRSDTRQSIPCWWRSVGCTLTASACYVRSSRTSARSRHCCLWIHTGYRYGCRTTASQLERQRKVGSHFGQWTIAQIGCP